MAYKVGSPLINTNPIFLAASKILYLMAAIILTPVIEILYHFKVKGRRNLELAGIMPGPANHWRRKPCILISNHVIPLDPVLQGIAIFPRSTYFTLLEESVLTPGLGTLIQLLGGVPVPRSYRYLPKMDEAVRWALQHRGLIHFYPEGECFILNQEIKEFKAGAFYYAIENQVPIVPLVTVIKRPRTTPQGMLPQHKKSDIITAHLECVILPAIPPPSRSPSKVTNLHQSLQFAHTVRDTMQAAIDAEGGDKTLYRGPMPRIKGVNDKPR
ncbi:MAG TPA: lysophospholipid acyltransferase family protein [Spirochaetales bacterium]|nr:lysophospholipid acyltransferase family protein [Spirochaetales bacterium]